MRVAVKLAFEFGTLLLAQERPNRTAREYDLKIEGGLLLKAKTAQDRNRAGAPERERCFVDTNFWCGIKNSEHLNLRDRPFRLMKRATCALNGQNCVSTKHRSRSGAPA